MRGLTTVDYKIPEISGNAGHKLFDMYGEVKWLSEEEYINHPTRDGSPPDEVMKALRKEQFNQINVIECNCGCLD